MTPPDPLLWFAVLVAAAVFVVRVLPSLLVALMYLLGGLAIVALAVIDRVTP